MEQKVSLTDSPEHGSLVVVGYRWFDRKNGNTYHTAKVIVNGTTVHTTERAYGYGDQYLESASEWLEAEGYITRKKHANGSREPLWQHCRDRGINLSYFAVDVSCKRDLG